MAKKSAVDIAAEVSELKTPALEHDYSRSGMVNALFSMEPTSFSGVVRSLECYDNQGHRNFRILTMYVEKGKIAKVEVSDPYAVWEAIQKMGHWNELSSIHLNSNWENGRTLTK